MGMRMWSGLWLAVLLGVLPPVIGSVAEAAGWSRAYINALPDEAFAVVENGPDGVRARQLPHHARDGKVDLPHLRNAMSRLNQVKWLDPASADRAREHLIKHYRELGLPAPGEAWAGPSSAWRPRVHIFRSRAPSRAQAAAAPNTATSVASSAPASPAAAAGGNAPHSRRSSHHQ